MDSRLLGNGDSVLEYLLADVFQSSRGSIIPGVGPP